MCVVLKLHHTHTPRLLVSLVQTFVEGGAFVSEDGFAVVASAMALQRQHVQLFEFIQQYVASGSGGGGGSTNAIPLPRMSRLYGTVRFVLSFVFVESLPLSNLCLF